MIDGNKIELSDTLDSNKILTLNDQKMRYKHHEVKSLRWNSRKTGYV